MKLLYAFIFTLIMSFASQAAATPILEPFVFTENFESGAVGPWAGYPPSQDTAYDPSIRVLPLLSDKTAKNRALYREITPNYDIDYEFGVRKRLDMYVNSSSVLTFKAFVKSYRGVEGVRVLFGFSDETMAERLIPFTASESWQDCRVDFRGILSPGEMKKIDAVAFIAVCPNADPETMLRFGVDDVRLTGMRAVHFRFAEPLVHRLEEFPDFISGKHYTEGGTLTLSGTTPVEAQKVTVTVSPALTGGNSMSFTMRRTGNNWHLSIPLHGGKNSPGPGFWRATINGTARNGEYFSTSFVFLVSRKDAPSGHPSLYYSRADIDPIMAKTTSGQGRTAWEAIQDRASRLRSQFEIEDFRYTFDAYNEVHWLPVFGNFGNALRNPQNYIRDNAVVYGLTGDAEAGNAAVDALMKLTEWPAYVAPHILNQGKHSYWITGIFLTDIALGYDLVYDLLDNSQREIIASSLYEKGILPVFREYVQGNWVSSNTSNWLGDVTGGSILCSMAIYEQYGDEALEPYLSGSILKLGEFINDAFDPDGDYGEGVLYYMHALHGLTKSMAVLERAFNVQFPEKLGNSHHFLLYTMNPDSKRLYTFGDSYDNLMSFSPDGYLGLGNMAYLLKKYRDPYLKWIYDFNPGTTERDLYFADDTLKAESPGNLPKINIYREVGTTVFRSGFSGDDFLFVFRCGPYVNHQHFDQGTFFLSDRGEDFISEMGFSDYYDDLWYQKLNIQAGGHNCILLDGNPESQGAGDFLHDVPAWKNYAFTTDFFTFDGGGFVSGRLDPVYKGKMNSLRRNVLYIEPRTILLIDETEASADVENINLLFHAPFMEDIIIDDSEATISRPGGSLTIKTAYPDNHRTEIMRRPMTLREIRNRNRDFIKKRGYLQVDVNVKQNGGDATVVNVLTTDNEILNGYSNTSMSGHLVLRLGEADYLVNTSRGGSYTNGNIRTDALVFSRTGEGWKALRAREVSIPGMPGIISDRIISVAFTGEDSMRFEYNAPEGAVLTFTGTSRPRNVLLDGMRYTNWRHEAAGLRIELAPGNGVLVLR